jgi:serine/threonine protein kinase
MMSSSTFLETLRQYNLLEHEQLDRLTAELNLSAFSDARSLADELCRRGLLTSFQADEVLQGRAAELVLGPYVLRDKLGEGGMGAVYRALHTKLKAVRAIKIIHPDAVTSKRAVERFYRESQAVARLKHPNIILAHDANEDAGRHYFVMEYAPGRDLSRLLRERGRLPVAEACEYIRQAALGLQHAHEQGMVHRDIKPSNLLLATDEKRIKILDLGLARLREAASGDFDAAAPITPNGMLMGTPDYMAPEQAEDSSGVDIRADIYSLGCSLYQLLTGSVPYPGGSLADKLRRHYSEEPPRLAALRPDAPAALGAVVAKMLAKLPAQRYQTPAEVAEALRPFCSLVADDPSTPLTRSPDVSADSHTPLIVPQTLELPATPLTGTEPIVSGNDVPTRQIPADHTAVLPSSPRKRRLLVPAALLLLAAGGAAAVIFWPKGKQPPSERAEDNTPPQPPPRVVEKDPTKKPPPPKKDGKPPEPIGPTLPPPSVKATVKEAAPGEGSKPVGKAGGAVALTAKGRSWLRVETICSLPAGVRKVAFSGDGRRADVLGRPGIELYDTNSPSKPTAVPVSGRLGNRIDSDPGITDVALSADGSRLVFNVLCRSSAPLRRGGAALFTIYDALAEWDGTRLRLFFNDAATNNGGRKLVPSTRCLTLSPDGKLLLSGTGTQLRVWDLSRAKEENESAVAVLNLLGPAACLACSQDSKHAAVGLNNTSLRLFHLQGEDSSLLGELKGHGGGVRCVTFTPDAHILSGDSEGALLVWRVPAQVKEGESIAPLQRLDKWHDKAVACVASAAQGPYFATGGMDGLVCLGKIGDKQPLWRETSGGAVVKAVAFSADGQYVLFATEKGLGRLPVRPLSEGTAKK